MMCKHCIHDKQRLYHESLLKEMEQMAERKVTLSQLMSEHVSIHTTEAIDGAFAGSAATEEDGENTDERDSEGSSQSRPPTSESENFAPDPYDEASKDEPGSWFGLTGRREAS